MKKFLIIALALIMICAVSTYFFIDIDIYNDDNNNSSTQDSSQEGEFWTDFY